MLGYVYNQLHCTLTSLLLIPKRTPPTKSPLPKFPCLISSDLTPTQSSGLSSNVAVLGKPSLTLLVELWQCQESHLIVLVSYLFILVAILRMNSSKGRYKAFSTCSSHLTVVVVFYATLLFMYLQPKSSHTIAVDKMASVFYTLVTPMLNPLIYGLRNKEVQDALRRTLINRCKIPN